MTRDRFLIGILAGIGVLVLAALILFFVRRSSEQYVDDSTSAGVLQNYILALRKQDYARAYGYLADSPNKPDLDQFRQPFLTYQSNQVASTSVEIGEMFEDPQNQTATFQVTLLQGSGDLFGGAYRNSQTAVLVKQNGVWKIRSAPYPFAAPEAPFNAPPKVLPTSTPAPAT